MAKAEEERRQKEEADWRKASEAGADTAWERYLAAHRDSPRRQQAESALAEARSFRQAAGIDSHEGWLAFQSRWPDGAHRAEAIARLQEIQKRDEEALNRARSVGTAEAYRNFLAAHGSSPLAAAAKSLLAERTDFDLVAKEDTEIAWRGFLEKWPSGVHAAASAKKLEAASQREEHEWQEASGTGTATALQKFLKAFPAGRYRQQADRLLRELAEFETAEKAGKSGYERFLLEHPGSRHAKTARVKLQKLEEAALGRVRAELEKQKQLAEQASWNRAAGEGSDAAWDRYLAEHADSSRGKDAERHRAEAHDFGQASSLSSWESWISFQEKWPEGPHRVQACEQLEQAQSRVAEELDRAVSAGTAESYRAFLAAHGSSLLTPKAKSLLAEQTDFDAVLAHDSEDAWRGFLERWPGGARGVSASERLRSARQREERDWQEASGTGSAPALLHFLQTFPSGRHHGEAEALLWELTELGEAQMRGKPGYERFLEEHPRSRHGNAVREKLQELEDAQRLARIKQHEEAPQVVELTKLVRKHPAETAVGSAGAKAPLTPKVAASRTTEPEVAALPPARKSKAGLLAIAAAVVVSVVLWLWLGSRTSSRVEPTAQAPPIAAPRVEHPGPPTRPPAPVAELGDLAIDVVPWGRVDLIEDSRGKKWSEGLPQYTPLTVRLPPGKYSVFVSNPNYADGLTITVEVRAGQRTEGSGRFFQRSHG